MNYKAKIPLTIRKNHRRDLLGRRHLLKKETIQILSQIILMQEQVQQKDFRKSNKPQLVND